MDSFQDYLLVTAHTQAGWNFIAELQTRNVPFAVLITHENEYDQLQKMGIKHVISAKNMETGEGLDSPNKISNIYLFEKSAALSGRIVEICRFWTKKSIYIILEGKYQHTNLKTLGADHVIFSKSEDLSFLLNQGE